MGTPHESIRGYMRDFLAQRPPAYLWEHPEIDDALLAHLNRYQKARLAHHERPALFTKAGRSLLIALAPPCAAPWTRSAPSPSTCAATATTSTGNKVKPAPLWETRKRRVRHDGGGHHGETQAGVNCGISQGGVRQLGRL